jgi:hypothetical protein
MSEVPGRIRAQSCSEAEYAPRPNMRAEYASLLFPDSKVSTRHYFGYFATLQA